jgi:PhnB protein
MAKPRPDGYTAITPYLVVPDVKGLMDFLTRAFGATVHFKLEMPGGAIGHADMVVFGSHVMMGQAGPHHPAVPGMLYLYVDDADAVHARALAAGGVLDQPVKDQFYGDRAGSVKDANGNIWWISTHKEDLTEAQIAERMAGARGTGGSAGGQ